MLLMLLLLLLLLLQQELEAANQFYIFHLVIIDMSTIKKTPFNSVLCDSPNVTIGSGPNRCRCLFFVRPPRLVFAEGLRPSRLLRV
jgi:hypothetical protein